jgi:histidinol-phosphate aminotransferase
LNGVKKMDIEKLVRPSIRDLQMYEPGEDRDDAVKLSSNENPRGPHPKIIEAVDEAVRSANRYPLSGSPALTRALAEFHGVTPGEVMVGNGSNEIIDLLVRVFIAPDENVVFPWPSFIVYNLIPMICGVEGRPVLLKDYRLDLPAMLDAVDDKTRMVFVCNPNNPTSTYVTAKELDDFLAGLRGDVLVAVDEAYIDYVNAPDYPDSLELRERRNTIITLRTFSKFHSIAGVRVGYAVADPAVIGALHKARQPFNVSLLAQAAGLAALQCGDDLKPMAEETIRERERLRSEARKLGMECPESQTNFIFADLGDSELDLFVELEKHGVIVRRMGQFGSSTNTYRISVGTPEENDKLLEALRTVCGAHTA